MATSAHRTPNETFAGYSQLECCVCPSCGILYAVPQRLLEQAREKGNWQVMWYCPNGHHLGVGENELAKLRQQVEQERQRAGRLAAAVDQARAERDQAQAQRRAQKAATTRLKRRVANGVCPCCKRTFQDLHRHMQSQHPDFGGE